ncbi:MAG: hypothetical protein ACYSWZ_09110 [Planctomycetota bacterium]|jgi:hypothetical protein
MLSSINAIKTKQVGLVAIIVLVSIGASSCRIDTGHPHPYNEIYEVKDPNTHRPVLRISNTKWDGWMDQWYSGTLKFRQPDGVTWRVSLYGTDPNHWEVVRFHPEKGTQEIVPERIYRSLSSSSPFHREAWADPNSLKSKE